MKLLLVDNHDSFTYNLLHLLEENCGKDDSIEIIPNEHANSSDAVKYDKIIISPGSGIPSERPQLREIILSSAGIPPILGICLGHQAIAESFGSILKNYPHPYHGIKSSIKILDHSALFKGLPCRIEVGRYHSWSIDPEKISEELKITAVTDDGEIMSISHRKLPIWGVQFHPESFLTEYGGTIVRNFLNRGER